MSLFTIGLSGLQAAQNAQMVVGNNISNVNTPGYHTQQVVQSPAGSTINGSIYYGQGTSVTAVSRIYNSLIEAQVRQTESQASYYSQYMSSVDEVSNVLGDNASGVASALNSFFSSWNALANDPSSTTTRQSVISSANTLANAVDNVGNYLDTVQRGVNTDIQSTVTQVNGLVKSIAKLNNSIVSAKASGQDPNSLLDQRDQLVSSLNKLVGVKVVEDNLGNYNLYLAGGGYQLLSGATPNLLTASNSPYDASRIEVYGGNGSMMLSQGGQLGGSLGGLVDFRSESLDLAQNSLGRLALAVSSSVNALHTTGVDANGNAGGDFFNDISTSAQTFAASSNSSTTTTLNATISNSSELTLSNYNLSYDGTNYTLTRLSDGTSWNDPSLAALSTTAAQGFTLSLSGTVAAGDSFLIRPTSAAASALGVAITDPSLVAAADTGSTSSENLDNTIALSIAALQNDSTLVGGASTLGEGYTQLVGTVASKASEVEANQKAAENLFQSATATQQSISGVNLDEEAAKLLQYQQAYQAAAKLISTASTMFDSLLNAM